MIQSSVRSSIGRRPVRSSSSVLYVLAMTTKSDRNTTTLLGSSGHSICDLDHLPLIRRRRNRCAAAAPLKSFLRASTTVLIVLLTCIVVYLVFSLCGVQRQLTSVRQELTSASARLDILETEIHRTHKASNESENHTLEDSNRTKTRSKEVTKLQRLSPSKQDNGKEHNVASKLQRLSPRKEHNVEKRDGESRSRRISSSGVTRSKRKRRDKRHDPVWKVIKELRKEMQSIRHDVSHPSALLTLPDEQETSNEDFSTDNENAIQWEVEHNSLFDTRDSTHLVVKSAGTYFVYLQITYNGQSKKLNPTCSHIVMLENPNYVSRKRPLLYGSNTQYGLGQLIRIQPNGGTVRAIDTVHMSGVFHFTVGDLLFVKPDDFSRDCIVSPLKDKTFFGAFRLQSSFHDYS